MKQLSDKELNRQLELIRLAFLAKLADTHEEIKVIERRNVSKYIKDFLISLLKNLGFNANVEVKMKMK